MEQAQRLSSGGNGKLSTEIDQLASLIHKHMKVVFDLKLVKHLNSKPARIYQHLKCLEKYKFIQMGMDPVYGVTVEWKDESDLISNGYSQSSIKNELSNRGRIRLS